MKTIIESNGSKWLGDGPDDIQALFNALSEYALDPTFEEYGNFIYKNTPDTWTCGAIPEKYEGTTHIFSGNFFSLSHNFHILTSDPDLIASLTVAIRDNQSTKAYMDAKEELEKMKAKREKEEERRIKEAQKWRVY